MSYDIVFWNETPKCEYDAAKIYRRLRRGLVVDGLKHIPRGKVEKIIRLLLDECEDRGDGFFEGRLKEAHVDIQVNANGILIDVPLGSGYLLKEFKLAFTKLGLRAYDPQTASAVESEIDWNSDYAKRSGDPDLGYWEPVRLTQPAPHRVSKAPSIGGQVVGDIEYSFFQVCRPCKAAPLGGIFPFNKKIQMGRASIPAGSFCTIDLDGTGTIAVIVVIPAKIIKRYANGHDAGEHVRIFTAFATEEKVIHYSHWRLHEAGLCAGIMTLREMPTRMKAVISTRFVYRG